MNHPTRRPLYLGIVLLLLALAFAAIANASSASASFEVQAVLSSSPDFALQAPPPPVSYTLTVNSNPAAGGSVTQNPPQPSAGRYLSGTVVTLTANPASGYTFSSWSGDASGSANQTFVTMNANRNVTANFSQIAIPTATATPTATPSRTATLVNTVTACYALTIVANPGTVGIVTVNTPSNCAGLYTSGTKVSLTAAPNPGSGYTFSNWTGCDAPSGITCTMTMNTNKSVTANFVSGTQPTSAPASTSTSTPAATSTSYATITPLPGGAVVTVAPTLTPTSSLPSTGASPLIWMAAGLVLVLVVIGARYMRQSSV